jgi:hypothetical protein
MKKTMYKVMVNVNDTELAMYRARNIASSLYDFMFGKPQSTRVVYFRNELSAFICDANANKAETYLTALLVRLESAGIAVGDSRTRSFEIQGE